MRLHGRVEHQVERTASPVPHELHQFMIAVRGPPRNHNVPGSCTQCARLQARAAPDSLKV